eukprot:TRINITY_DN20820_c0_g1_i2.p1 TRINITY_DN20820_c0_g1~~TRINITY_DN20820_c0_g1_i2.p1  ORF type:complete len:719 (+),score=121.85 TRINITY_DN20820_c0_g1_i2:282-2438(+)
MLKTRSSSRPSSLRNDAELLTSHAPRICFLGRTGSGKTSLMNAILGCSILPAEDNGVAVTSSVTEVAHCSSLSDGQIVATAYAANEDDWREKKRLLIASLAGDLEDSGSLAEEEMQDIARKVLAAACPDMEPENVELTTPECPDFLRRLSTPGRQPASITFASSSDAKTWLRDRVHLAESADTIDSVLTAKVRLTGNFARIPRDVILVDLPGLEDANLLRSCVAERYFALFCTHAWFCMPRSENRILSNRGLARQVRCLARGGTLNNVLVVRTRADEAARKRPAALDKEHEDFKKLCLQELRYLESGRPAAGQAASSAAVVEPPRQRRRTNDGSAVSSSSAAVEAGEGQEEPEVSFGGYVLATTAPAVDDMPACISIEPVVSKLQAIGQEQKQKVVTLLQNLYRDLERLMREEEEATQTRVQEEAERQRRAEEESRRQAEADRERRAQEARQARGHRLAQFRAVVNVCKARASEFRTALSGLSSNVVNGAVMNEVKRARPPNGATLRGLVNAGGIYTSPSRGDFDLPEAFSSAARVLDRDFPSAYSHLLEKIRGELMSAEARLGVDIRQPLTMHLASMQQQINAVLTRGGAIQVHCDRALVWPGGKGSADACVVTADQRLSSTTAAAVRRLAQSLTLSVDECLEALNQRVADRLGLFEERPQQAPGSAVCVLCQVSEPVARATRVSCVCNPRPPYACRECLDQHESSMRLCPICRGGF